MRDLEEWIEAWGDYLGLLPAAEETAPVTIIHLPPDYPGSASIAAQEAWERHQRRLAAQTYEERSRQVQIVAEAYAEARSVPPDRIVTENYVPATQRIIGMLGPNPKHVSWEAMHELYEAKAVTEQYAGSFGGHGSNAFYLEAFLPLHRLDGGVDTAHFRSVRPWFAPPYWELLEVQYGVAQKDAAAAAAEREKIRHINLLRARLATARLQGSMFAIVGGIGGIVEGAPLLGTLEAAAGVEQGGLAVADLATGKEHEALSARAIQAALEAAGLDTETARFLAHNGGLLTALGRATVDAAGVSRAAIETSTGYRINLEFDRATLSTNGLGGAKIRVTKLPPPVDKVRAPIGRGKSKPYEPHAKAEASEKALAEMIGDLPDEVVLLWGKQVTKHGADAISYNLKTKRITLWDDKFRSEPVRIKPSSTFVKSSTLESTLQEAVDAIEASNLSSEHKAAAFRSIRLRTYQTRTHGSGQVKNSTFEDHK